MKPRQLDFLEHHPVAGLEPFRPVPRFPPARRPELEPAQEGRPYALGLLACSARKLGHAAPAAELYQGPSFKLALELALRRCARVRILSARHGAVRLDAVLQPYDERLPGRKAELEDWGLRVWRQLEPWRTGARVLCLAPRTYSGVIPGNREWEKPLAGLGLGQQLATLKALLAA